jgi:hypothetical protein
VFELAFLTTSLYTQLVFIRADGIFLQGALSLSLEAISSLLTSSLPVPVCPCTCLEVGLEFSRACCLAFHTSYLPLPLGTVTLKCHLHCVALVQKNLQWHTNFYHVNAKHLQMGSHGPPWLSTYCTSKYISCVPINTFFTLSKPSSSPLSPLYANTSLILLAALVYLFLLFPSIAGNTPTTAHTYTHVYMQT